MFQDGFEAKIEAGDSGIRLVLSGELDLASADELESVIRNHLDGAVFEIDTTDLAFIDSTGLGILVSVRKQLGPDRFQLIPGDATLRILELSGTKDYLLGSTDHA
jgi:anti-anti-sigma factor